ncbi:hypothetical protein KJ359_008542 [Pestalotiopsis sp. 9143b]|nr:hypothetical protein KJ359_008542 [Pestalotiopsis sp. 9143b]
MRPEIVPLAYSTADIIAAQVEQNYWASTFDWSRLERLVVYDQFLALQMLPYLKPLRHVENTSRSRCFNEFFSQVPARLVTINVAGIDTIGLDALLRHGSTLRKLRMHQSEAYGQHVWQKQAVQESAMTQIRDTCVVLEELEVDIARTEGEWPYAMLDITASYPRLRRLGLWFEMSLYDKETPVKPYLTASAAREIFM